jgi:hypothetical protein
LFLNTHPLTNHVLNHGFSQVFQVKIKKDEELFFFFFFLQIGLTSLQKKKINNIYKNIYKIIIIFHLLIKEPLQY